MQIFKDGSMLYDSIDNTGTADNASLSARYTKGRLDTLEGNFNNYFDKTEVLDLLAQKVGAEFVDQLPADLETNVWYYSKKYADGTAVADDKRALYTKDANDVVQYLGIMGDIDLTNYQQKTDNTLDTTDKTVVGAVNEINEQLKAKDTVYNFHFNSANADTCVFNYDTCGYTSGELKIRSKRAFIAQIIDPIDNAQIFGYCETTQHFVSQGNLLNIEQRFVQLQSSNLSQRKEFFRKGSLVLDSVDDIFSNIPTKASNITWLSWIPIEYPMTVVPMKDFTAGRLDYCYYTINGGTLTFRGMYFATAQPNVEQTIWTLPAPMKRADASNSLIYVYPDESLTGTARLSIKASGNVITVTPRVAGEFRLMAHIPLGY